MKHKLLFWVAILSLSFSAQAQNPPFGRDSTLDIMNWNIEWFGDATNGLPDLATQFNNVKYLLVQSDVDIIALEEMSNATSYANLSGYLPAYGTMISTFSATQKMCLYWKKSMFEVIPSLSANILNNYYSDFGTRPPLQVALKTLGGTKTDTLFVIVVHMKANTGNDAAKLDSYQRRTNASAQLLAYLQGTLAGKKYIVLGDWNDDLNFSIYNGLTTPYKNILQAGLTFPTKELTDQNKHSTTGFPSVIDHQLVANEFLPFYYTGTAKVFDAAGSYINNYANNTSDHYPVYAYYNWKKFTTYVPATGLAQLEKTYLSVYPNPATTTIRVNSAEPIEHLILMDCSGKELRSSEQSSELYLTGLSDGMYILMVQSGQKTTPVKLLIGQ